MHNLTQSQEDYLEEIYIEIKTNGAAKVTDISNALNVKKASVSEALNTLASKGLIKYSPYAPIEITELGEKIASQILEKHELMANFFKNIIQLSEEEAQECACKIEHLLNDKTTSRIAKFSAFIEEYSAKNKEFNGKINSLYK